MANKQDETLNLLQEEQSAAPVVEPEPPKPDGVPKKKRTRRKSGTAKAETAAETTGQPKAETAEKKKKSTKRSSPAKKKASTSVGSSAESDVDKQESSAQEAGQVEAEQTVQPEDVAVPEEAVEGVVSEEKAPNDDEMPAADSAKTEDLETVLESKSESDAELESATVSEIDLMQESTAVSTPDLEDAGDLPGFSDLLNLPDFSTAVLTQSDDEAWTNANRLEASDMPAQEPSELPDEISELPDGISELPIMDLFAQGTEIDPLQMMTDGKAQESAAEEMQAPQPAAAIELAPLVAPLVGAVAAKPKKSLFARLRSWLAADDVAQAAVPAMAHIPQEADETTAEGEAKETSTVSEAETPVDSKNAEIDVLSQPESQSEKLSESPSENAQDSAVALLPEMLEAPVSTETITDAAKSQEETLEVQPEPESLTDAPQEEIDGDPQTDEVLEALETAETAEIVGTVEADEANSSAESDEPGLEFDTAETNEAPALSDSSEPQQEQVQVVEGQDLEQGEHKKGFFGAIGAMLHNAFAPVDDTDEPKQGEIQHPLATQADAPEEMPETGENSAVSQDIAAPENSAATDALEDGASPILSEEILKVEESGDVEQQAQPTAQSAETDESVQAGETAIGEAVENLDPEDTPAVIELETESEKAAVQVQPSEPDALPLEAEEAQELQEEKQQQEDTASNTKETEKLSAQELARERRKQKKEKKKARRAAAQEDRGSQIGAQSAALAVEAVASADTSAEAQDASADVPPAESEQSTAHAEEQQTQESQDDRSEVPDGKETSEAITEAELSGQEEGTKSNENEPESPQEDGNAEKPSEAHKIEDADEDKAPQDELGVALGKQLTEEELAPSQTGGQTEEELDEAFEAVLPRHRITAFKVFISFTAVVTFLMALFVVLLFLMSDNTLLKPKNEVDLPNFYGKKASDIVGDEAFAGFSIEFEDVYTGDEEKGTIIDQRPKAPRKVKENAKIVLRVSAGVQTVEVPDVSGIDRDEAKRMVRESGLNALLKPIVNETVDVDDIVETEPKAGTVLNAGETITLYVSRGQQHADKAKVPNCIGMSSTSQVATLLSNRGLMLGAVRRVASSQPAGTIIDQSPAAGSVQPSGTAVTITISAEARAPVSGGAAVNPSSGVAEDGHQHAFSVQAVPATGSAPGFTIHTCTICGFYTLGNIG